MLARSPLQREVHAAQGYCQGRREQVGNECGIQMMWLFLAKPLTHIRFSTATALLRRKAHTANGLFQRGVP